MSYARDLDTMSRCLMGGNLTAGEQRAASVTLLQLAERVGRMERTLDEIVRDAQEDELAQAGMATGRAN